MSKFLNFSGLKYLGAAAVIAASLSATNAANAASVLTLVDVAPGDEISQTGDDPCVIGDKSCGNNQPAGMDWTVIGTPNGTWDEMSPVYTVGQILDAVGEGGTQIAIGIDVNPTGKSTEVLDYFTVLVGTAGEYMFGEVDDEGPSLAAADNLRQGTGFSDWLLVGLDLAGYDRSTEIKFFAGMEDTGNGLEQFFLTNDFGEPNVVPVPAALPLLGSALGFLGFAGWRRKRKAVA